MSSGKRRLQDRDADQDLIEATTELNGSTYSEVISPRIAKLAAKVRKICDGLSSTSTSEKTFDVRMQQLADRVHKFCEDLPTSRTRSIKKSQAQQLPRPRMVRKELFKVPAKRATRTSIGGLSNNKIATPKLPNTQHKSVSTPKHKLKFVFNTPKSPSYKFTSQLSSIQEVSNVTSVSNCDTTPTSHDANDSFVFLENLCAKSPVSEDSPTTGVCELLQNNLQIGSAKKDENMSFQDQIQKIIDQDRLDYEQFIEYRKRYESKHEDNMQKILELIKIHNTVTDNTLSEKNKENIKRRSLRLSTKSPRIINPNNKKVMSPAILKSGDLRKSALTKSLVTKYEKYQLDASPRIRNAERMYNETKKYCSVLTTPRNGTIVGVVTPRHLMKTDLSRTIHDQFMLMQDTPKHH